MQITIDVPDDLASRLSPIQDKVPQILELGLREFNASAQAGLIGVAQVLEILAGLPSPEEVLALRPSEEMQGQLDELLAKSKDAGLSPGEELQWQQYEYVEHLVRMAKAQALLKLQAA